MKTRIKLLLVPGMAIAVLALGLWFGLMVSATPAYADDGSADETTTVDETTTGDETTTVDETTPTDETTTVDETTPTDETTTVDETTPTDETTTVDETTPTDETTTVDETTTDGEEEVGHSYTATITPTTAYADASTIYEVMIKEVGNNKLLDYATVDVPDEFETGLTLVGTVSASGGKDWSATWNGDIIILTPDSESGSGDDRLWQNEWIKVSFTATATTAGTYNFNTTATCDYWSNNHWQHGSDALQGSQPQVTVTVPLPSISISDASAVIEGGPASFTVTLSAASTSTVTVKYNTADGTATAGSDYTSITNGTITFNAGETEKTITVSTINDITDEADETFKVNLSNPTNATIADSQGVGTILDNDLSVTDVYSSDADGNHVDSFSTTQDVWATITISGGTGSITVDVYVTADKTTWNLNDTLTNVSGDTKDTFTFTSVGTYKVKIWSAPTTVGDYDIVVDANQNGKWGCDPWEPNPDQVDSTYTGHDWHGTSVGFTVHTPKAPTITGVYSSEDSLGTPEDDFLTTEDVYATITTTGGEPGGTVTVYIYVTAEQNWSDANLEQPLTDISGGRETVTITYEAGVTKYTFLVWSYNTSAGNFDIVVDVDQDGKWGCPVNLDVVDSAGTSVWVWDCFPWWGHWEEIPAIGFTVSKTPLTVTADDQTITYGDPEPTYTIHYDGFANGDDADDLDTQPTASVSTVPHINVGTYTITCSGGVDDVYDFIYVDGTLTIEARPITVTADDKAKTYGDADPALTYSITSGSLAFSDYFEGDLTRDPGQDVGTYAITQGTLVINDGNFGNNYALTFVNGTLTINQKPASVTPDDNSKTEGDADPVPLTTGTLTGFLPADGVTATYARDLGETVGDYTIYATLSPSGVLGNYAITYNTATFTITAAPAALTAAAPELVLCIDWFGIVRYYAVNAAGVLLEDVNITNLEGTATLVIPAGTLVLDEEGNPLYLHRDADIMVTTAGTPEAPAGATFAAVYELLPSGVIFQYGEAELIVKYDPATVTPGSVLVIAYYDEAAGEWVEIETAGVVVGGETVSDTVSGHFAHFTYFALLVKS